MASRASRTAASLGLDPVTVRRVAVGSDGGPEGAAREARHTRDRAGRRRHGVAPGAVRAHARRPGGDGAARPAARQRAGRAVRHATAGAADRRTGYGRPLLGVRRHTTRQATVAAGLVPWTTRRTTTPRTPACGCGPHSCPCWSASSAPGAPRRSPDGRAAPRGRRGARPLRRGDGGGPRRALRGGHLAVRTRAAGEPAGAPAATRAAGRRGGVRGDAVADADPRGLPTGHRLAGQGPIDLPGVRAARDGDRLAFSAPS